MNRSIKEYKADARFMLRGNYSLLIMSMILISLIHSTLSSLFASSTSTFNTTGVFIQLFAEFLINLLILLGYAGVLKMVLNIMRHEPVSSGMIFYAFKDKADRYITASILLVLYCSIPMLLSTFLSALFVPDDLVQIANTITLSEISVLFTKEFLTFVGISLALSLASYIVVILMMIPFLFTYQILSDNPDMAGLAAVRESGKLTRGHYGRILRTLLSFLGWMFLGLLTLGIGYLWIIPYIVATLTSLYTDLTQTGYAEKDAGEEDYSSFAQPNE